MKPPPGTGAHERDRTADLILTKDVLYQLSYVGLLRLGNCLPGNDRIHGNLGSHRHKKVRFHHMTSLGRPVFFSEMGEHTSQMPPLVKSYFTFFSRFGRKRQDSPRPLNSRGQNFRPALNP